MKKVYLGCTFVLSAALIWSSSIIAASNTVASLDGWNSDIGKFWTAFGEAGGVLFTMICLALFIVGVCLVMKKDSPVSASSDVPASGK